MDPNNYGIGNLILPSDGPGIIQVNAEIVDGTASIDLTNFMMQVTAMKYIQGVCIDTLDISQRVIVQLETGPKHRATGPANSMTYSPLFVNKGNYRFIVTTPDDDSFSGTVPLYFYNVPIQPVSFAAAGGGGGSSDVNVTGGNLTGITNPITAIPGGSQDFFPTNLFALDGTSQTLVSGGTGVHWFVIYNSADNPITLNFGGDATVNGIVIQPGGTYEYTMDRHIMADINISGTNGESVYFAMSTL